MLRHFTPVAFLAFTLMLSILPARPAWSKPAIEVVFVLDTTGSMGPLIEGAKRKIWSIATTLIDCSPDAEIRMGLVAYRDIGDDYVTKTFKLTTDIQGLYADLLELRARGGGDWPESVNEALQIGVTKMNWSSGRNSTRIIFLVGDAPPHMDYAQDTKYPDVMRLARARDITINTVQAGSARDTERYWREIAQMGRGEYMAIPQDGGKIVVIETPYDREIIELQGRINRTVVPYGSQTQQRGVRDRLHAGSVAPAPVASDMAGYMAKRAARPGQVAEAITGAGDLVGDVASGRQSLSALNERLTALVGRRDRHIADTRSKAPRPTADSFDQAVERTLRSQIAR
jgi:Mg-chelatase subunit ChlD